MTFNARKSYARNLIQQLATNYLKTTDTAYMTSSSDTAGRCLRNSYRRGVIDAIRKHRMFLKQSLDELLDGKPRNAAIYLRYSRDYLDVALALLHERYKDEFIYDKYGKHSFYYIIERAYSRTYHVQSAES